MKLVTQKYSVFDEKFILYFLKLKFESVIK